MCNKLTSSQLVFKAPWEVGIENKAEENSDKTVIRNYCSVVSPGTELAILAGTEDWAPLPYVPGYGSVGTISTVSPEDSKKYNVGDCVFTYGQHAEFTESDIMVLPVPEDLDPKIAVFARMAAVSITAVRCSNIELGDKVAVFGGGLVGNFAAQLAQLAGADVTLIDPSDKRCKIANACGLKSTVSNLDTLEETLSDLTGGENFSTVIEASGRAQTAYDAIHYAGKMGELILLGSPRAPFECNLTNFLNKSHLCPNCVTIKGAHEWRYPVTESGAGSAKHSLERNVKFILKAMKSGDLKVKPLITHEVNPEAAANAYEGLRKSPDEYMGVVINWRSK